MSAREAVVEALAGLEAERGIRVLYACESGSRAWGFPSPDSDYDVRFVYVHPRLSYLSIREPPETIDLPLAKEGPPLDLGGWDLRKTLRLVRKSNASPLEWLQSPIVYREAPGFRAGLTRVAEACCVPRALVAHYLGLAGGAWRQCQERTVRLKKVFYVLRPLLAARWVAERRTPPPMELEPLLGALSDQGEVVGLVRELVALKAGVGESYTFELPSRLREFLADLFRRIEPLKAQLPERFNEEGPLDEFFRQWLEP